MKQVLLVLSMAVTPFVVNADTTNKLSQWGITWEFDSAVQYGRFANGDYWVLAPVTITNMTPAWDGINNGWEINPTVSGSQGFYAGGYGYDPSLRPAMPITITTAASLVKTIGRGPSTPVIETAAVLTILTNTPPAGGLNVFRPPYVGTAKPLYLVSSIRWDLLPTYKPVGNPPSLTTVQAEFSKSLRIDHHTTSARQFRPVTAMKDYQPENTPALNEAMLRLMLDDSQAEKLPAMVQFTQHTIDRAHAILLGYRNSGTGHNPNHRVLAAWAAVLLDIEDVKACLASATGFHEDEYLYDGINGALWGQNSTEQGYWNYIMGLGGSRSQKDPYNYIDGGLCGADYQIITSQSLKGQALVYILFPALRKCIPEDRYRTLTNYARRWVSVGTWAWPDPAAPYDGIRENYGITFGPDGSGSYIPGSGRFPAKHGSSADGGQYRSAFVADMWNAYANQSPLENPKPPINLRAIPGN